MVKTATTGLADRVGLAALCLGTVLYVPSRQSTPLRTWYSRIRVGMTAEEECMSPINPGDSGGPVANDRGELIAVTTGDVRSPNLFIDVEEVKQFLARYYETKRPRVRRPPPSQIAPSRPPQP
jgi:Trypsin